MQQSPLRVALAQSHSIRQGGKQRDDHRSAPAGHSIRQWPPPPVLRSPPSPSSSSYPSPPPRTPTTRYRSTGRLAPPSPSLAPSKRAHYMRRKTCSPPPWCRASQRQRLARLARSAPHTLDPRSLGVRSACRRPGRVGSLCIARRVELSSGC